MRQSFMVDIPNMLEELKLSQTQTNFVVKSYKSVYRNSFETVSMDIQMQTICKVMLERFNFKLKKANLSKLATYRYYYLLTYSVRINMYNTFLFTGLYLLDWFSILIQKNIIALNPM